MATNTGTGCATGRPTDHRNLDLAKLHNDVCFGRSNGMIIWQPRIGCWWQDRKWDGRGVGRYEEGSFADMYRSLGCSDRLYGFNECFKLNDSPKIVRRAEKLDDYRTANIVETPVGSVTQINRRTDNSWAQIVESEWVQTPDDMKVMTWICGNSEWVWDQELFDRLQSELGDLGAATMFMPRVNVQNLYIDIMGVEAGVYAIYEWGSVLDDYFKVLHQNHMQMIDVINASPVDIINFGDNIHCTTLSPALYEEYVLPAYLERCDKLHRAGKFVSSHWDGGVKSLLKYAKVSGLDGIEAITPQPQGDVTLEEIKDALGDEIFLLDGIPAIFFDKVFPAETLEECAHKVIELFAPKLILGISDEMSSMGDLERIRVVGKVVDNYNASIESKH
ncbi:MAG: uroporphyrinogen decarboxylase family protein [Armatimonadota bacterium]|nr:hypothetical protein [bacterium]